MTMTTTSRTFSLLSALLLALSVGCADAPSEDASTEGAAGQHSAVTSAEPHPADQHQADTTDGNQEDADLDERGISYNTSPSGSSAGASLCWRDSSPRGAGVAPTRCGGGKELDQGLCYPVCKAGFKGVGPVCWSTGTAAPYGRGEGVTPACDAATPEMDAGLCYARCGAGYAGVGPVCWKTCPTTQPFECGGACSASETTCATLLAQQITAPIIMLAQPQMTLAAMLSSLDTANAFKLPLCGG
jgi:hypothetical protein